MDMAELETTVERCRDGDEDAWSALVSTTLRPVYRLCASYAPSASEAEELTQEVYFKLWENLHRYKPGSNFMAWAWRVAKNLIIDSQTERRQRLRLIATSLRQIPEELATLILMRDFAGLSYNEISEATELPLGTVKSRLNRARLELATSVRRRTQIRVVPPGGQMIEGSA
ncbi:MAG: sigma-70 family RNA polymerase sigma factor [Acidobacteriota bacterium]